MNNLLKLAQLETSELKAILDGMTPEELSELAELVNNFAERCAEPTQNQIDEITARKPRIIEEAELRLKKHKKHRPSVIKKTLDAL